MKPNKEDTTKNLDNRVTSRLFEGVGYVKCSNGTVRGVIKDAGLESQ